MDLLQIDRNTESIFLCFKWKRKKKSNKIFEWTECKHLYCIKCVINIINDNLSSLNIIPKCLYPKCNKLLNKIY